MKTLIYALGFPVLFALVYCQRLVPVPATGSSSSLGQFNAPCFASSQCQQDKGLYCVPPPSGQGSQPRCRCPTNGTLFDETRFRCVGKIGENCVYQGNTSFCPANSHCSHQDPRNPTLYFYESKCFCDPNYIPNDKGTCTPAARYGEYCNNSEKKCDLAAGLVCDQETSTCICEFDTAQYFDKEKSKCLSFIGNKCTTYYGCVENARCEGLAPARSRSFVSASESRKPASSDVPVLQPQKQQKTSSDGRLIGKCVCEYGFSPANNGRCMASYRYTCSKTQICNPFDNLQCQDGSCNCKSPLHQFYDFTRKKCMTLVNGKCSGKPPGHNEECVDNAECVNGLCTCNQGYSQTPYRRCMLDYKQACENNCNQFQGLTCKSQQCTCMDDSLVYNEKLKACVSLPGMPCGKIGHVSEYGNGKDPYYVNCEPPAVCKPQVDGDLSTSVCKQ